jgi:hypothetical protein
MSLKRRIEQQEHWRQADAVRDGRQLPVDPDSDALEEIGDGFRLYSVRQAADGVRRVCKRLVDGKWQRVEIEEPAEEPRREAQSANAHVA